MYSRAGKQTVNKYFFYSGIGYRFRNFRAAKKRPATAVNHQDKEIIEELKIYDQYDDTQRNLENSYSYISYG